MKVVLVHNRYREAGGEDRVVAAEAALLEQHGHEVVWYTADNADIGGLRQFALPATTVWSRRTYREVGALLRRERADVVHVHNTLPLISPSVYYAARAAGVPVVQTLHNFRLLCVNGLLLRDGRVCEDCVGRAVPTPGVIHACYRGSRAASATVASMLALHRAAGTWRSAVDVYIALTEFARAEFIRGGLPAAKIVVKPNSVSANEGPPYSARADADYALFVGRLSPEKGLETLLEAWKAIGSALPLKIVGEGPLARRVEAEADGRAVCWLGAQPPARVAALMRGARLAVVPSVCYEGFSLVVAEAFAAGRPLIASDLGSIASLVSDGVTGVLVPPGDARALAAAVHRALAHPDEMAALGAAGHRYYQEHLTPERNYAALLEVYARAARIASASEARSR